MEDLEDKEEYFDKFKPSLIAPISISEENDHFSQLKFEINSRLDDSEDFIENFGFTEKIIDDINHNAFEEKILFQNNRISRSPAYLDKYEAIHNKEEVKVNRKRKMESDDFQEKEGRNSLNSNDYGSRPTKRVRVSSNQELTKLVDVRSNSPTSGKIMCLYT